MRISDWSSDVCSSDLLIPRQCVQLEAGNPRIRGNIGDRVLVTREVGRVCEVAVEHPVKAVCLFRVALQTVSLLGGVESKMVRLPESWTDSAHLEHQPLDRLQPRDRIGRQQSRSEEQTAELQTL